MTYGVLSVRAYCKGEEVAAEVEVVGVGIYHTPFELQIAAGNYILIGSWMGQQEIKSAVVEQDKTTVIDFYFEKPSLAFAYFYAAVSALSLIISIISLLVTATRGRS